MMIPLSPVERAASTDTPTGAFEVTGEKITASRDYFGTSADQVRSDDAQAGR
jgi:hypothetical protein